MPVARDGDAGAERRAFGLDRWLQYKSAEVLFKHGLDMDKEELGSPNTRAEQGLHPAGVPKRRRRDAAPPTPLPPRDRETHTLVNVYQDPKALPKSGKEHYRNHRPLAWWTRGGRCCACQKLAEVHGYMEYEHTGRNEKPHGTRHMPLCMPDHWKHVSGGSVVPHRMTACYECSRRLKKAVWLCVACHESANCWDHEMARPASYRSDVG